MKKLYATICAVLLSTTCTLAFSGLSAGENEAEILVKSKNVTVSTVDTKSYPELRIPNKRLILETNRNEVLFYHEAEKRANYERFMRLAVEHDRAIAEQKRIAAQKVARKKATPVVAGTGRCGGDLPPCYVMMRESRGSLTAQNPHSTASGKWQFLNSTWGGYGGYSRAADAPESVQDARARELWNNGRGCSHWSAC